MTLAAAMGAFGLFLLLIAILVLNSQRKNRLQLRRLNDEVERVTEQLRTPEEQAERTRRIEAIEARNRVIHGRFDSGGC